MSKSYDWQVCLTKVVQRSSFLLRSSWRSDVQFLVGKPPNQQIFKAHKLILAMASPVFDAMLFGDLAEKNQPILIPDLYPDAFQTLLQYIYTDDVFLNSVDKAVDVCYAAKKYLLPQLVRDCTYYIWKDMSANNVCKAYEFAKLFDVPILMEKCLHKVASSADDVFQSESIQDLSMDTMRVILTLDEMNLSSELIVFNAAIRWAEHECERRELEISGAIIRQVLDDLFYQIRFLCMSAEEFACGPAKSDMFSDEEMLAFLLNIACPGSRQFPKTIDSKRLLVHKRKICNKKFHCTLSFPSERFSHSPVKTELCLYVDKDILLHGIQFNSQIFPKPLSSGYTENVLVQVCNDDEEVMAETHFSGLVAWDERVDVSLAKPFPVEKHRRCVVRVIFDSPGSYKCYSELLGPVLSEGVHFTCTYLNGILIGMHTITFSCPDNFCLRKEAIVQTVD